MYVVTSPIARWPPLLYLPARPQTVLRPILLPGFRRSTGRGLGAPLPADQQQIAAVAATAATATASILVALGTVGGPVGAVVAGLAAVGIGIANLFGGCGQSCVVATQLDNRFEALLQQNLNTYLSSPVHYRSLRLAALNNFDTLWGGFQQMCSNAGVLQKCVADRQAGACHYHVGPSGSVCWNWFTGYRDPIANDPAVVPDPSPEATVAAAGSSVLSALGVNPSATIGGFQLSDLLLPAALFAAAAMV